MKSPQQLKAKRVALFQTQIDSLQDRGYKGVVEIGNRGTIEYRQLQSAGNWWEAKRGTRHVGLFATSGEAVNALWEIDPFSLDPKAQLVSE